MKKKSIMNLEYRWEVLLVYLIGILGLVFSFMKDKDIDPDVKFQYNQSATIFIISVIVSIANRIISNSLSFVALTIYIFAIIQLVLFVFSIITIIKAFNDETYEIPYISNLAKAIWK